MKRKGFIMGAMSAVQKLMALNEKNEATNYSNSLSQGCKRNFFHTI